MIKYIIQYLQRTGILSLIAIGATVVTLWTVGNAGASSSLTGLFTGPPPPVINYQGDSNQIQINF